MARAGKVCSTDRCPVLLPAGQSGKCDGCKAEAEARRGTAGERGYDRQHRAGFRRRVLVRDPLCVCTDTGHKHHGAQCLAPSRHADHHPVDRRTLVLRGQNPNDPRHGRGLCGPCHSAHTAAEQPGGWAIR